MAKYPHLGNPFRARGSTSRQISRLIVEPLERRILLAGDLSFDAPASSSVGSFPEDLTTADVNGDGIVDIVTANKDSNDISILLGAGDGSFAIQNHIPVGNQPRSVVATDLNRDGTTDLVVSNQGFDYRTWTESPNTLSVLIGHGDGTFTSVKPVELDGKNIGVFSGDFNGDGFVDLVTANTLSDDLSLLLGNGDGSFQSEKILSSGGNGPFGIAVADFDVDGDQDMAVANSNSNNISILLGNGDGTFQRGRGLNVGRRPWKLEAADLDRDGNVDLVVANNSSHDVSVLLGNGDATFAAQVRYASGEGSISVSPGDLDGDGDLDLIVTNGGGATISALENKGDGTFAGQVTVDTRSGNGAPSGMSISDIDTDGRLDVVVSRPFRDAVDVFLNTTTVSLMPGDSDGNGRFDQLDIVAVLQAAKYLAGQPATFVEGDWNRDDVFDQKDIVTALQGGHYLQGPHAAAVASGRSTADGSAERAVDALFENGFELDDWIIVR